MAKPVLNRLTEYTFTVFKTTKNMFSSFRNLQMLRSLSDLPEKLNVVDEKRKFMRKDRSFLGSKQKLICDK